MCNLVDRTIVQRNCCTHAVLTSPGTPAIAQSGCALGCGRCSWSNPPQSDLVVIARRRQQVVLDGMPPHTVNVRCVSIGTLRQQLIWLLRLRLRVLHLLLLWLLRLLLLRRAACGLGSCAVVAAAGCRG